MRKAQAAMEFLMTYGWAILVVLAAIAALAYFGVLSPSNMLPETATGFNGIMNVGGPSSSSTGNWVGLTLVNDLGDSINVTGASFTTTDCTVSGVDLCPMNGNVVDNNCLQDGTGKYATGTIFENSQKFAAIVRCSSLSGVSRVKGTLNINYTSLQSGMPGIVSGQIQVQPK